MPTDQELRALGYQRSVLKRQVGKFEEFLRAIDNESGDAQSLFVLDERINDIRPALSEFEKIQSEMRALDVDSAELEEVSEAFSDRYHLLMDQARRVRFDINLRNIQVPSKSRAVALPTISLPKFSGDAGSWLNFRDTFISIIHNDSALDGVQKFQYLKSSLSGPAAAMIDNIACASENYIVVWEMLCERYDDTNYLINNHLKLLFNLRKIIKPSVVALTSFVDEARKHLRVLEGLKLPVDQWDAIVLYLLVDKLDPTSRAKWEESRPRNSLPTVTQFLDFVLSRIRLLEATNFSMPEKALGLHNPISKLKPHKSSHTFVSNEKRFHCLVCDLSHNIFECPKFRALNPVERKSLIRDKRRCFNCFSDAHMLRVCQSRGCRECGQNHHTLLHPEEHRVASSSCDSKVTVTNFAHNSRSEVLLSTIKLYICDVKGKLHLCRALLDSGSQSNFISSSLLNRLKLRSRPINIAVAGLADSSANIKSICNASISSRFDPLAGETISCLVSQSICSRLPLTSFDKSFLSLPDVQLADPDFSTSGDIDLLLGAEVFWNSLLPDSIKMGKGLPVLNSTRFGYILSGRVNIAPRGPVRTICNLSLLFDLQQFWRLDEIDGGVVSDTGFDFEQQFLANYGRDSQGRFVVTIPFSRELTELGDSRQAAAERFASLERRFNRDPDFKASYTQFMDEYLLLGHMQPLPSDVRPVFILPHHGVLKEDSTTTKLRVVFDGSCKTSTGVSLNDIQRVGPTVQDDLISILLRFRKHAFVASADVTKMYRCVMIEPNQRKTQCILWRTDPSLPLTVYQLNTVTYGTASAPYLATRCLKQLAFDDVSNDAHISDIIKSDFYIDDLLTGFDDIYQAQSVLGHLFQTLNSAKFELRKWRSNDSSVISQFIHVNENPLSDSLNLSATQNSKILGLHWDHVNDLLSFNISAIDTSVATKRKILSAVSQVFDPLGLLSPCTVRMKILIQLIWLRKLDWDDPIEEDVADEWRAFCGELVTLNQLGISRRAIFGHRFEIHGFADASERAYGAAIYIRSFSDGKWTSHLLCSKTKVSPLKTLTIPRLELCAALLLVRLLNKVFVSLHSTACDVHLWSDSMVVLHWIRTPSRLLNTFVANRVAEIQNSNINVKWHYVQTKDNPADCASRGLKPHVLLNYALWWHGPAFLSEHEINYTLFALPQLPQSGADSANVLPEQKQIFTFVAIQPCDLFFRYSSLDRLLRVVAWCRRILKRIRSSDLRVSDSLTPLEIHESLIALVKVVQSASFPDEIGKLSRQLPIVSSRIRQLSPFLDDDGVLRVGGRLKHSDLPYTSKHPILLPKDHIFVLLLFRSEHEKSFHAGAQLLHYRIRERFWVLSGRSIARKTVFSCVKCFRSKPARSVPSMGNLPSTRVTVRRPFTVTGVDFAGPVLLRDRRSRKYNLIKAYISIFVCFTTKAIHIELVSDLTGDAFIAALRRFVARRGLPSEVHCDNGRNFVGANNTLREFHQMIKTSLGKICSSLTDSGILFKFIAPHSPHLGGLWEAGVKSIKTHLKRTIGLAKLTFEEYATLLTQIESILNSRPLGPLSVDPSDLLPLTPAHFLLGEPARDVDDPDLLHLNENQLSAFQHLQFLKQQFWKRWSQEYLRGLQTKTRAATTDAVPTVGRLVLLMDESTPPLVWPMARITHLHTGDDGVVRVVSLKTAQGSTKRAVTKICLLPTSIDS